MENEKIENRFVYEANAIVEGTESDATNFVHNRSDTPEGAESGLRPTARVQHVDDYRKSEELRLANLEVWKLDPEKGYEFVQQVK